MVHEAKIIKMIRSIKPGTIPGVMGRGSNEFQMPEKHDLL
jgi:hypothetical protein